MRRGPHLVKHGTAMRRSRRRRARLGYAMLGKAKHSKAKQTANTNGTKIWSKKERGLAPLFPTNHPTPVRSNFTCLPPPHYTQPVPPQDLPVFCHLSKPNSAQSRM